MQGHTLYYVYKVRASQVSIILSQERHYLQDIYRRPKEELVFRYVGYRRGGEGCDFSGFWEWCVQIWRLGEETLWAGCSSNPVWMDEDGTHVSSPCKEGSHVAMWFEAPVPLDGSLGDEEGWWRGLGGSSKHTQCLGPHLDKLAGIQWMVSISVIQLDSQSFIQIIFDSKHELSKGHRWVWELTAWVRVIWTHQVLRQKLPLRITCGHRWRVLECCRYNGSWLLFRTLVSWQTITALQLVLITTLL